VQTGFAAFFAPGVGQKVAAVPNHHVGNQLLEVRVAFGSFAVHESEFCWLENLFEQLRAIWQETLEIAGKKNLL
jgi:hypothetical protein